MTARHPRRQGERHDPCRETCGTCRFYAFDDSFTADETEAPCQARPPFVDYDNNPHELTWPWVPVGGWCGLYERFEAPGQYDLRYA